MKHLNAGVTMEGMTKYGLNRILVVNYFSRFLFINLLLDKMKKQSAERPVRIVNLISDMYKSENPNKFTKIYCVVLLQMHN